MKKRSVGVTVFGILFILGGVLRVLVAVATPLMSQVLDRVVAQVEQLPQEAATREGGGRPGAPSPQQVALLKERMTQTQAVLGSPQYRIALGVGATTSLAALVGGIGILWLKLWAHRLVLITAGISLLWAIISSVVWSSPWYGLIIPGVWNGLVLWYFLRPSMRAPFAPATGMSSVGQGTSI